jgi:hypothetical protein
VGTFPNSVTLVFLFFGVVKNMVGMEKKHKRDSTLRAAWYVCVTLHAARPCVEPNFYKQRNVYVFFSFLVLWETPEFSLLRVDDPD